VCPFFCLPNVHLLFTFRSFFVHVGVVCRERGVCSSAVHLLFTCRSCWSLSVFLVARDATEWRRVKLTKRGRMVRDIIVILPVLALMFAICYRILWLMSE
jgi:hypothetical protein